MSAAVCLHMTLGVPIKTMTTFVARGAHKTEETRAHTHIADTVGCNRCCVATAVRGCRALGTCGVSDVADVTGAARRSSKRRQAGTGACGVGSVRRH